MKRVAFILLFFLACFSVLRQDTLSWQEQLDQLQIEAKTLSKQAKFDSAIVVAHQAIRFSLEQGGDTSKAYSELLLYHQKR